MSTEPVRSAELRTSPSRKREAVNEPRFRCSERLRSGRYGDRTSDLSRVSGKHRAQQFGAEPESSPQTRPDIPQCSWPLSRSKSIVQPSARQRTPTDIPPVFPLAPACNDACGVSSHCRAHWVIRRASPKSLDFSLAEARKDLRCTGQTQPSRAGSDHFQCCFGRSNASGRLDA